MSLREKLKNGKFVVTAEIGPAKGVDIHEFNENADLLKRQGSCGELHRPAKCCHEAGLAGCLLFA